MNNSECDAKEEHAAAAFLSTVFQKARAEAISLRKIPGGTRSSNYLANFRVPLMSIFPEVSVPDTRDKPVEVNCRLKILNSADYVARNYPGLLLSEFIAGSMGMEWFEQKQVQDRIGEGYKTHDELTRMPRSFRIYIKCRDGTICTLPQVSAWEQIYEVYPYQSRIASHAATLRERTEHNAASDADLKEIRKIAEFLATEFHRAKHPSKNEEEHFALYDYAVREILFRVFAKHVPLRKHPLLRDTEIDEWFSCVRRWAYKWGIRPDRLRASHWDFNPSNILMNEDGEVITIDRSFLWADPGVDVGWLTGEYLCFACVTGRRYFKELAPHFLDCYEAISEDKEIRKATLLGLIRRCALRLSVDPQYTTDEEFKKLRPYFEAVKKCLEEETFDGAFFPPIAS